MTDNHDGSFDSAHIVRFSNIIDEDRGDLEPIRETHRAMLLRADIEDEEISFL